MNSRICLFLFSLHKKLTPLTRQGITFYQELLIITEAKYKEYGKHSEIWLHFWLLMLFSTHFFLYQPAKQNNWCLVRNPRFSSQSPLFFLSKDQNFLFDNNDWIENYHALIFMLFLFYLLVKCSFEINLPRIKGKDKLPLNNYCSRPTIFSQSISERMNDMTKHWFLLQINLEHRKDQFNWINKNNKKRYHQIIASVLIKCFGKYFVHVY